MVFLTLLSIPRSQSLPDLLTTFSTFSNNATVHSIAICTALYSKNNTNYRECDKKRKKNNKDLLDFDDSVPALSAAKASKTSKSDALTTTVLF
jgi:hypothetical protein